MLSFLVALFCSRFGFSFGVGFRWFTTLSLVFANYRFITIKLPLRGLWSADLSGVSPYHVGALVFKGLGAPLSCFRFTMQRYEFFINCANIITKIHLFRRVISRLNLFIIEKHQKRYSVTRYFVTFWCFSKSGKNMSIQYIYIILIINLY